jgi:hypothetical protein
MRLLISQLKTLTSCLQPFFHCLLRLHNPAALPPSFCLSTGDQFHTPLRPHVSGTCQIRPYTPFVRCYKNKHCNTSASLHVEYSCTLNGSSWFDTYIRKNNANNPTPEQTKQHNMKLKHPVALLDLTFCSTSCSLCATSVNINPSSSLYCISLHVAA